MPPSAFGAGGGFALRRGHGWAGETGDGGGADQEALTKDPHRSSSGPGSKAARLGARLAAKEPVLRFVAALVLLVVVFNAVFYVWFSRSDLFGSYLALNAKASAAVLTLLGEQAIASGDVILSPMYELSIRRGCDAIQPAAFYAIFVIASPLAVSVRRKLAAIVAGVPLLLLLNLLRIISLYYVGVWWPAWFDWAHVEVWQPGFVILPLLLWLVWLRQVATVREARGDRT